MHEHPDDEDGYDVDDLTALDFSPSEVDAHDDGSDLAAFDTYSPDDVPQEDDTPLIRATNPPATVSVIAQINGAVHRVELAPPVTDMTEPQLAEEICVVADVAAKKATSAMYVFVSELLVAQGIDRDTAETFVAGNMSFATPAMARSAESALVARHASEH